MVKRGVVLSLGVFFGVVNAESFYFSADKVLSSIDETPSQYTLSDFKAEKLADSVSSESLMNDLLEKRIRDLAYSYGVQLGYRENAMKINEQVYVYNMQGEIDKAFDFKDVQLEQGFYPPVIVKAKNTYKQDGDKVRKSSYIYTIVEDAHIYSHEPRWENYLLLHSGQVSKPDRYQLSVLKDSKSKKLWDKYITEGYNEGLELAKDDFRKKAGLLMRDYYGMLEFKELYVAGLVTKPRLNKTNYGVIGGERSLEINTQGISKTYDSQFNPNVKQWIYK